MTSLESPVVRADSCRADISRVSRFAMTYSSSYSTLGTVWFFKEPSRGTRGFALSRNHLEALLEHRREAEQAAKVRKSRPCKCPSRGPCPWACPSEGKLDRCWSPITQAPLRTLLRRRWKQLANSLLIFGRLKKLARVFKIKRKKNRPYCDIMAPATKLTSGTRSLKISRHGFLKKNQTAKQEPTRPSLPVSGARADTQVLSLS
jgi:hypothetical protein